MTPDRRRDKLEAPQPILLFAATRVVLALIGLVAVLALGFPVDGDLALYILVVGVPWTVAILYFAYRNPAVVLSLYIAAVDFAVLLGVQLVAPEAWGALRFIAIFLIAVHAHLQGERRGVAIAVLGTVPLTATSLIGQDGVVTGTVLAYWEVMFVASTIATALLVGRLQTAESALRVRARLLTRRTLENESDVRRRVAESIHDGPVQDLIALDLVLAAASQASRGGDGERAAELMGEARELAVRNITMLRDELVDLGPHAFEELSFGQAVENCMPAWERRYGVNVKLDLEDVELEPKEAGGLFRVVQEAVTNAGRHGEAESVAISLRSVDGQVELRVTDDGHGFGPDTNPVDLPEPGHLGLAAMRERAELLDGSFQIDSAASGTEVLVSVPRKRRARRRLRR